MGDQERESEARLGNIEIVCASLDRARHGEDIVRLLDEYAQDPMGGGTPLSVEVKGRLIASARAEKNFGAFIAYRGETAAGLLTFVRGFSTFAAAPLLSIHDLAVSLPFRRRGVGTLLLKAAEQEARSQGCCKLTLEVLSGNQPAMKVYEGFGFEGYQLDPQMGTAYFWQKTLNC